MIETSPAHSCRQWMSTVPVRMWERPVILWTHQELVVTLDRETIMTNLQVQAPVGAVSLRLNWLHPQRALKASPQ